MDKDTVHKTSKRSTDAPGTPAALPKLENFPIHRMVAPTSLIRKWQLRYHHTVYRNQQLENGTGTESCRFCFPQRILGETNNKPAITKKEGSLKDRPPFSSSDSTAAYCGLVVVFFLVVPFLTGAFFISLSRPPINSIASVELKGNCCTDMPF